jgi:hypothetical protein
MTVKLMNLFVEEPQPAHYLTTQHCTSKVDESLCRGTATASRATIVHLHRASLHTLETSMIRNLFPVTKNSLQITDFDAECRDCFSGNHKFSCRGEMGVWGLRHCN